MIERGFVLPLVLIVLALLMALSMGLSRMAGVRIRQAEMSERRFAGGLALGDASQTALYYLLSGRPEARVFRSVGRVLPIDGTPVRLAGQDCRIQDLAGLLSLGEYRPKPFARLLRHFTDGPTAARLAARLGDWIDADAHTRYLGMELPEYLAAGLKVLPRNGPLRSLDELLEIPGFSPALLDGNRAAGRPGLRDLVSAGGVGWFNAASAPEWVLEAYLNLRRDQARALIQARERGDWKRFGELVRSGGVGWWDVAPDTPSLLFRLRCALAQGPGGRVQIQLKPRGEPPYRIQLWQYPDYERL